MNAPRIPIRPLALACALALCASPAAAGGGAGGAGCFPGKAPAAKGRLASSRSSAPSDRGRIAPVPPSSGSAAGLLPPSAPACGGAAPATPGPALPTIDDLDTGDPEAVLTALWAAGASLEDPLSWRAWWRHNRDAYLGLREAVHTGRTLSGSDEFFLGVSAAPARRADPAEWRPSAWRVREELLPALLEALDDRPSVVLRRELMQALGRVAAAADPGDEVTRGARAAIRGRLADPDLSVALEAVLAHGLAGDPAAIEELAHVMHACERGRELLHRTRVPSELRARAAYALGLAAGAAERDSARVYATHHLVNVLKRDDSARSDLRVACIDALGLCAPPASSRPADLDAGPAGATREGLADFLLAVYDEPRNDRLVRAHVPRALARVVDGLDGSWRARTVDALRRSLGARSNERLEVRRGAALALGELVDADDDEVDRIARDVLERALDDGDQATRRFALLALGQVAGRPGAGEGEPLAATDSLRRRLLRALSSGRSTERPYAALALGLMGHGLEASGVHPSEDVARALMQRLRDTRSPGELGAYAIALGLRRDGQARAALEEALEGVDGDPEASADVCIALGMLGARASVEVIEGRVDEAEARPGLLREVATALALLRDEDLVPELTSRLEDARAAARQGALAGALGAAGDERAFTALLDVLGALESTDLARASAARALGEVADVDELPWRARLSVGLDWLAATETLVDPAGGRGLLDRS